MDESWISWIDVPVVQAIEYFSGIMATFFKWGTHYAVAVGTVGLIWSAFKLANSRFTLRDFWWDTMYKWLLFILFMSLYPIVTLGMAAVSNRIGIDAGKGKQAIIDSLTSMKYALDYDYQTGKQLESDLNSELSKVMSATESITFETTFGNSRNYDDFINKYYDEVDSAKFNSLVAKKAALDKINLFREKNKYHGIFSKMTLAAINDILVEKLPDGTDGDNLSSSYVDLNIWLKDAFGNDTYYLSPAAIMRVSVLACQIMWERNEIAFSMEINNIDNSGDNFVKKGFSKVTATFCHIPSVIMTLFCCIILVFCSIFACLQYLMTILEYTVVVGIGAFFIPFILFDGTKELPKKLIPVFTGFVIKMIVITICLFFVFYLFIQETVDIMSDSGGMNWVTFVTVVFNCIIGFVLTQNAPKIAMTLLTGQPQLSFGEFAAAAGTLAFGTFRSARSAGHVAKEGTRTISRSVVNAHGGIAKANAARKTASDGVKAQGGTKGEAFKAGANGMFAAVAGDLKDKIHSVGNSFLHGGGKGAGGYGGSSGNGAKAHQRNGQNTSRELDGNSSRTLDNNSNPSFKGATRFDEKTQSNVNMTRREFYDEKREQGENIGKEYLQKMAEKKQQAPTKDVSLPDNLTGEERKA